MSKYQVGIILIIRDRFYLYIPGVTNILEFKFVAEIVNDLEIVDYDLFLNLLKVFIDSHKLPLTSLVLVISEQAAIINYFSINDAENAKDASLNDGQSKPSLNEVAQKKAIKFLENVPFEETAGHTILVKNSFCAFGTNKLLFETIKEGFENSGFEILGAYPIIAFGEGVSSVLNKSTIDIVLSKYLLINNYNMLNNTIMQAEVIKSEGGLNDEVKLDKKPDKKRQYILAGVFTLLLIVLVIVYMTMGR